MATAVTAATRPATLIRLVGGPVRLDGTRADLSDPHDRADCEGDRIVRVVRGSSDRAPVGSLAALIDQCTDRAAGEALAGQWLGVVYRYGRDRRLRTRYYRYQSTHRLVAVRDGRGGWTLILGESITGHPACDEVGIDVGQLWDALEGALDRAAGRFGAVAELLPEGPMAERASSARTAVGACVRDGARLCGVGRLTAPDWAADSAEVATTGPGRRQAGAIARQVATLVATIDEATSHLVDLHLEVGADHDHAHELVGPVAHISVALSELSR